MTVGRAPRRWRFGDDVAILRQVLERGGVVIFPTESSYGVGVDPRSRVGVDAVYRLKERERGKPLGVVVAGEEQARMLGARSDDPALRWALERWPAPLSVLVSVRSRLPAMGDEDRLSIRVPDHAELRELLERLGPLTATSANRAGESPIVEPLEAAEWAAGADSVVVDGGVLPGGEPSTVVSWEALSGGVGRPKLLRSGRFPISAELVPPPVTSP